MRRVAAWRLSISAVPRVKIAKVHHSCQAGVVLPPVSAEVDAGKHPPSSPLPARPQNGTGHLPQATKKAGWGSPSSATGRMIPQQLHKMSTCGTEALLSFCAYPFRRRHVQESDKLPASAGAESSKKSHRPFSSTNSTSTLPYLQTANPQGHVTTLFLNLTLS